MSWLIIIAWFSKAPYANDVALFFDCLLVVVCVNDLIFHREAGSFKANIGYPVVLTIGWVIICSRWFEKDIGSDYCLFAGLASLLALLLGWLGAWIVLRLASASQRDKIESC